MSERLTVTDIDSGQEFVIVPEYGRAELSTWMEPRVQSDGSVKHYGMGRSVWYDLEGNVERDETYETGVVAEFA